MNGVAIGADDVRERVLGAPDVGAGKILGVAGKAGVQHLSWSHDRERANGGFPAAGFDVRATWPVAAFAAYAFRRFFAGSQRFIMRILEEVEPHVGVTGLTDLTTDVARGLILCVRGEGGQQEHEPSEHFFTIVQTARNTC